MTLVRNSLFEKMTQQTFRHLASAVKTSVVHGTRTILMQCSCFKMKQERLSTSSSISPAAALTAETEVSQEAWKKAAKLRKLARKLEERLTQTRPAPVPAQTETTEAPAPPPAPVLPVSPAEKYEHPYLHDGVITGEFLPYQSRDTWDEAPLSPVEKLWVCLHPERGRKMPRFYACKGCTQKCNECDSPPFVGCFHRCSQKHYRCDKSCNEGQSEIWVDLPLKSMHPEKISFQCRKGPYATFDQILLWIAERKIVVHVRNMSGRHGELPFIQRGRPYRRVDGTTHQSVVCVNHNSIATDRSNKLCVYCPGGKSCNGVHLCSYLWCRSAHCTSVKKHFSVYGTVCRNELCEAPTY